MKRQIEGYQPTDKLDTSNPPKCEENWINVKDKLPETDKKWHESDHCLIFDNTKIQTTAWYSSQSKEWCLSHYSCETSVINVTHWMPLPKPPTK